MKPTISEIQTEILTQTGLKTSVSKGKGSMKGYFRIMPIFQNGTYPNMPHDFIVQMRDKLSVFGTEEKPIFCTISDIYVFDFADDRQIHKKESKGKEISEMKVKEWGSKNSQMRLDKTALRYAKKRKGKNGDNMVKYW
jgi:hypothetical protein